MSFDYKSHCKHCVVCNRANTERRGGDTLQPLGILEFPSEIVGIDYVTDLPKSSTHGYTTVFIMIYHLTKRAHFAQCYKEITKE